MYGCVARRMLVSMKILDRPGLPRFTSKRGTRRSSGSAFTLDGAILTQLGLHEFSSHEDPYA